MLHGVLYRQFQCLGVYKVFEIAWKLWLELILILYLIIIAIVICVDYNWKTKDHKCLISISVHNILICNSSDENYVFKYTPL